MAVINPNIGDVPATTYNAAAVTDKTDDFAGRSDSLGTGVISGMGVTAAGTLTLTVAAGTVTVLGVTYTYAGGTVAITTNAGALDRRDVVIYRVGTGITKIDGTAASYTPTAALWSTSSTGNPPVKPAITESTDVVICEVYMPYNASTVGATPGTGNGYVIDKSNVLVPRGLIPTTYPTATPGVVPIGQLVVCTYAGGAITVTLPTSPVNGSQIGVLYASAGYSVQINAGGTDTILNGTNYGSGYTLKNVGSEVIFTFLSGTWYPIGGLVINAGGDLTGAYPNPVVNAVQGVFLTAAQATLMSQLNGATARFASATVLAGEVTVTSGATNITLQLPAYASTLQATVNTIVHNGSGTLTVNIGTGTTINVGTYGGAFTLLQGMTVSLMLVGTVWTGVDSGWATILFSTIPVAKGGTGSATAAGALTSLGGAARGSQGLLANLPASTGNGASYFATDDYGGTQYIDYPTVGWTQQSARGLLGSSQLIGNSAALTPSIATLTSAYILYSTQMITYLAKQRTVMVTFSGVVVCSTANPVIVGIYLDSTTLIASQTLRAAAAANNIGFNISALVTPGTGLHSFGVAAVVTAAGVANFVASPSSPAVLTVVEV